MDDTSENHIAVFAFPFGTHATPLLNLTRKLASSAPNATFTFFNTAKSNASLFASGSGFHNIKPYDVDDGVPEGYVFTGKKQEDIEMFISVTPNNFKKAVEKAVMETGKGITCFLTDAFIWCAAEMAEAMKVPWVGLWTAAACSLSAHIYTDVIRDTAAAPHNSGKKDLPLSFIPGMPSSLRTSDTPMEVIGGNLDSIFSQLLHQMGKTVPRCNVMAINSFEELEPSIMQDFKAKFQKCLTIGPLSLTCPSPSPSPSQSKLDPNGCLTWLDSHKHASVAYISFGTVLVPPIHEVISIAEALEQSGVPFLWSLKEKVKEQLPQGFLDRTRDRGMVVAWAPQSQVLEHGSVGVFITHCGWNSVIESITGGVPMICRPFFGDQSLNGRMVSHVWEIGVGAKDGVLSKDGLSEALDQILVKEEGKKMRENVGALKNLARQAVASNGTSTVNLNTLLETIISTNLCNKNTIS